MKKQILFAGLILFSSISTAALAHDDWYKKYDADKDGRWNYEEFSKAQREWQIAHHKHVMTEKEMRDNYEHNKNNEGFWGNEEARRYHNW